MTSMKITGDMKQYTQFQAAESLTQPNTNTGVGVELATAMSLSKSLNETTAPTATSGLSNNEEVFKTINQLHELKTKGIISENEFEAKKADLLSRIK